MKHQFALCAMALALSLSLASPALAAEPNAAQVCYPTAIVTSEDGTEMRKLYDLGPEDDPGGIPRSDFEKDGFRYTLTDLLKQELPENESRTHTETVSLESPSKDMATVLSLLPEKREFITDDGLSGVLTLRLESVQIEPSGYASATKEITATRSYPNLTGQDTQYIPKTVEENGKTLTLQSIDWQTDNTANLDGYAMADRYTAVATYSGKSTSSYVKGYTVTADYSGSVSRIALNKTRYVAIFEGKAIQPVLPDIGSETTSAPVFKWSWVLIPVGVAAAAGIGIGAAVLIRRRRESEENGEQI